MPVFLSHKYEDKQAALRIAQYLKQNGVLSYVDVLDPQLQTTDDITAKIMERIRQCTHLMAVVSRYTEKSWWVPFEIGVGSESERRITSYQLAYETLPEFLSKWPILKNQRDLDMFVRFYKQDKLVALSESFGQTKRVYSADQFHRELKAVL